MSERMSYYVVDAFAATPYSGNSAGVVPEADGLAADQMQAIAREINCSETAFVTRGGDAAGSTLRIRWFTPTIEVGFCGHATLAAAHVLLMARGLHGSQSQVVAFDSPAGVLRVRGDGSTRPPLLWLEMPEPAIRPDNTNPMKSCEFLGLRMEDLDAELGWVRTRDDDVILWIRDWSTLQELRPNLPALDDWSRRHRIRGWCVATRNTLSEFVQVCSRFFAPAAGVPEDPVTGSVHGGIAAFLLQRSILTLPDGRLALQCLQGQPGGRTGLVRIAAETVDGRASVLIGGGCHATLRGEIVQLPFEEASTPATAAATELESTDVKSAPRPAGSRVMSDN